MTQPVRPLSAFVPKKNKKKILTKFLCNDGNKKKPYLLLADKLPYLLDELFDLPPQEMNMVQIGQARQKIMLTKNGEEVGR